YIPYFEMYATGDINTPAPGDVYNNSGAQIVGYFYPANSGDFIFYLSADDGANLYLSPDADPAHKRLIAQESGWSGVRSWATVGGGSTVEAKASWTFVNTTWDTKDPVGGGAKITLTAGQAYYIEAIQKEGGGGDNLSVSIDGVSSIPGRKLSTFDKNSGAPTIITPPANVSAVEGQSASFTVVADG